MSTPSSARNEKTKHAVSISLVIPAHNEGENIRHTIESYRHALDGSPSVYAFEIILISNNCTDHTPQICAEIAAKDKKIVHFDFPQRIGKGGAVLEGFKAARFDLIGFVDADNSIEANQFIRLIEAIRPETIGAAIASKRMPGAVMDPPQPFSRQVLGFGFAQLQNTLFGTGVHDSQCGAKIFKRKAIEPLQLHTSGFAFDVELLYRAKQNGYHIAEIGIVCHNTTESTVSWHAPVSMLMDLVRLRLKI